MRLSVRRRGKVMSHDPHAVSAAPALAEATALDQFVAGLDEPSWDEFAAGQAVQPTAGSRSHRDLVSFLTVTMSRFVKALGIGIVLPPPVPMRLPASRSVRVPDLLFVSVARFDRWHERYVDGAADLVVEVSTGDTRTLDRRDKRAEYELAAVGEYWLIDPERYRAEMHVLTDDDCFDAVVPRSDGRLESRVVPGLWYDVAWFWPGGAPSPLRVAQLWGLVA